MGSAFFVFPRFFLVNVVNNNFYDSAQMQAPDAHLAEKLPVNLCGAYPLILHLKQYIPKRLQSRVL